MKHATQRATTVDADDKTVNKPEEPTRAQSPPCQTTETELKARESAIEAREEDETSTLTAKLQEERSAYGEA